MINQLWSLFSHDIGIDLGTANTLVYVQNKGIVIREPSVVAIHSKKKFVIAVGQSAKEMIGKTPANIKAIRPLQDGVISDFDATEQMLRYFIKKIHRAPSLIPKIPRPRVVIGIPSGVTEVERKAVLDAVKRAGARQVYLIEEPMAAAIGADLPIESPTGNMIIDIGGGTTEIAVISLGGIVVNHSIRVAGDEMDQDIIDWAKKIHNLSIGLKTSEDIKITIGAAYKLSEPLKTKMRGLDLLSGLPKAVEIDSNDIVEALNPSLIIIQSAIKEIIEETPPELLADIMRNGITLAGGGALLRGIDKLIAAKTDTLVRIAKDPLTAVVRGTAKALENEALLQKVRMEKMVS